MNANAKSTLRRTLSALLCLAMLMSLVIVPVGAAGPVKVIDTFNSIDPDADPETTVEATEEAAEAPEATDPSESDEEASLPEITATVMTEVRALAANNFQESILDTIDANSGVNIHLFDYGSRIAEPKYDANGNQIMPLIYMGGGNMPSPDTTSDTAAMYLDILPGNTGTAYNGKIYTVSLPNKVGGLSRYLGADGYPFYTLKNSKNEIYTASLKSYFNKDLAVRKDSNGKILAPYDQTLMADFTYWPNAGAKAAGKTSSVFMTTSYDVLHYPVSGGLFFEDGNYLVYDSRDNHAYYDYETQSLKIANYGVGPGYNVDARYTGSSHFLPFTGSITTWDPAKVTEYADGSKVANVLKYTNTTNATYAIANQKSSAIGLYRATTNKLYRLNETLNTATNDLPQNKVDMFLGMSVDFTFYQPENGMLATEAGGTENMIFEFSGDDLMYVYVDGVQLIDLAWSSASGLPGGAKYATINFATGDIYVYMVDIMPEHVDKMVAQNIITEADRSKFYYKTSIRECFEAAKNEGAAVNLTDYFDDGSNTFKDNLKLEFKMFYMDTGAGTSNCYLRFNMDPLPANSITVEKDVANGNDSIANAEYGFTFDLKDQNGNAVEFDELAYTKRTIGGTVTEGIFEYFEGTVGFTLTDDESITFILPSDGAQTTYFYTITEDSDSSYEIAVDGSITTAATGSVSVEDVQFHKFTNTLKPEAVADSIVIDYGMPVDIDVRANDIIGDATEFKLKDATDGKRVTTYGEATLENNKVRYTPRSMKMSTPDVFYYTLSYGELVSDGEVTVIPANNIYYEDSFVTTTEESANQGCGIYYSGELIVDGTKQNDTETPEDKETAPNGGVHGWEDNLADDTGFSDGSGHYADASQQKEDEYATATFTFTGTGVDIYGRTSPSTGTVVGMLDSEEKEDGWSVISKVLIVDTVSESGDYYQIPTLSFMDLPYGTYTVTITVTKGAESEDRFIYYLDGIRVYNPMQDQSSYAPEEQNAIFKEVRDILLDKGSFESSADVTDENGVTTKVTSVEGAVFIDEMTDGTLGGEAKTATIGTYKDYGPKNEVYLSKNQAVTFKVAVKKDQYFYIGLKSPNLTTETGENGDKLTNIGQAKVSAGANVEEMAIAHSTDMYYKVQPDSNGFITIQNTGDGLLSVTKLRTTGTAGDVQIQSITEEEALDAVAAFALRPVIKNEEEPVDPETPDVEIENPTETEKPTKPVISIVLQSQLKKMLQKLFDSLNGWFH